MPKLAARALKCTLVLDPLQVMAIGEPQIPRVLLHIELADGSRTVTAEIAAKSVRKALATIAEHGAEGVACIIQGKLGRGDVVQEVGLVVQPKQPKPQAQAA